MTNSVDGFSITNPMILYGGMHGVLRNVGILHHHSKLNWSNFHEMSRSVTLIG